MKRSKPLGECAGYTDADLYEREVWYMWEEERKHLAFFTARYEEYVERAKADGEEPVDFVTWSRR